MHFGYLNRNWVQKLVVPVGPNNSIEPGGPDQGQPTVFRTRTNRDLFTVAVPKDFGKKELIWTLTANGKTNKSYGWLLPEWEIDPVTAGRDAADLLINKAPVFAIEPVSPVTLPATLPLTGSITDDGLPKPQPQRRAAIGQEEPDILKGGVEAPVNVPAVARPRGGGGRGSGVAPPPLTVTWLVWRGPADATFTPSPVTNGKVQTVVTFTTPGEYVLRGEASDRALETRVALKVTVR